MEGRFFGRLVFLLLTIGMIAGLVHRPHADGDTVPCVQCACLPGGRRKAYVALVDAFDAGTSRWLETKVAAVRSEPRAALPIEQTAALPDRVERAVCLFQPAAARFSIPPYSDRPLAGPPGGDARPRAPPLA